MKALSAAVLLFLLSGPVYAGERRPAPPQTICPISGKQVDWSTYVDVDGFRIFTLGPVEADQVRKNPGQAFAAIAKNRQAAQPVVWKCPSMMRDVDPTYPYVQQGGKRIFYCCGPCQPRIKGNFNGAAAVMKRLAEQGG